MLVLAGSVGGCDTSEAGPFPSVRLGMTPRDVRGRFEPGGEGSWKTGTGAGDDTVLEWRASAPGAKVPEARFEFHHGMLVAIRARLADAEDHERVAATVRSVTLRRPAAAGGTEIAVLARDCPSHRQEAESLALKAR